MIFARASSVKSSTVRHQFDPGRLSSFVGTATVSHPAFRSGSCWSHRQPRYRSARISPEISHSLCGLTKRRTHAEPLLQMTRGRFRLGQPVRRDHSPVGERNGRVP
jgi:hypothetical protein